MKFVQDAKGVFFLVREDCGALIKVTQANGTWIVTRTSEFVEVDANSPEHLEASKAFDAYLK